MGYSQAMFFIQTSAKILCLLLGSTCTLRDALPRTSCDTIVITVTLDNHILTKQTFENAFCFSE